MVHGSAAHELRIYTSPARFLGFGGLCLMCATVGWMLIREGKGPLESLVGWLMLVVFGLGAMLLFERGLQGRQLLLAVGPQGMWVNPSGLLVKTEGVLIPWEEIAEVKVHETRVRWSRIIELKVGLRDPARIVQQLGLADAPGKRLLAGIVGDTLTVPLTGRVPRARKQAKRVVELAQRYLTTGR